MDFSSVGLVDPRTNGPKYCLTQGLLGRARLYSPLCTKENLEDLGEIAGNFYSHLFTCFSIFQTILDGLAKFQCSPNILTMKKIGSNSIFLYSQYYEKTYFSLPPIAVEIPALMDRSSQAISKNTILWWPFETLCVQFQMETSIALSNITWLMSSMTSMTLVKKI